MDDKTLTALKGSIAKWDAIADGTGADKGSQNCPLCVLFLGDDEEGKCEGCPVFEKTKYAMCGLTPYGDWWGAYRRETGKGPTSESDGAFATTEHLKMLARKEADFLRSLLPESDAA